MGWEDDCIPVERLGGGAPLGTKVNQGEDATEKGRVHVRQGAQPWQRPYGWLGAAGDGTGTALTLCRVARVRAGMPKGICSHPRALVGSLSSGGRRSEEPFKGELGSRRLLRFWRLGRQKQKEQSPEASFLFCCLDRLRQAGGHRQCQRSPTLPTGDCRTLGVPDPHLLSFGC